MSINKKLILSTFLKPQVEFKLRINTAAGRYLGPGRIELLILIGETGSINKAAKSMGMSYKKAWQMVHEINEQAAELIVIAKAGGEDGGGSALSEKGVELVDFYRNLIAETTNFIQQKLK